MEKKEKNKTISEILFYYVDWILNDAQKKGIKCLYFLARDGFLLKKIAEKICYQNKIDIELKYLYCSRKAIYNSVYKFLSDNEKNEIFYVNSLNRTINLFFGKFDITENIKLQICKEIHFDIDNINQNLSYEKYCQIVNEIVKSKLFLTEIDKISKQQYTLFKEYLIQENFFRSSIAVVDSGWRGTLQNYLNIILKNENEKLHLTGYYFGILEKKYTDDNIVESLYFNENLKFFNKKLCFNNVVFECLLPSYDGMTIGYEKNKDKVVPIFNSNPHVEQKVKNYIDSIMSFNEFQKFNISNMNRKIKKLMVNPDKKTLNCLKHIKFCDDRSEKYFIPLIKKLNKNEIKNCIIINKIISKIKRNNNHFENIYWIYGCINFSLPPSKAWFYRWNVSIYEFFRNIKFLFKK